jgi:hypothetical protein
MRERIGALGEFINQGLKKKINFKAIKMHSVHRGHLFSFGAEDYIVGDNKAEVEGIAIDLSYKKAEDYPPKLAKRYTHRKYQKASEKTPVAVVFKGKKYFIIKL